MVNVGKYSIHGAFGCDSLSRYRVVVGWWFNLAPRSSWELPSGKYCQVAEHHFFKVASQLVLLEMVWICIWTHSLLEKWVSSRQCGKPQHRKFLRVGTTSHVSAMDFLPEQEDFPKNRKATGKRHMKHHGT